MEIWRLKKGSEKKFKTGHPWVFSSELAQSPKALIAGALVELRDAEEHFLAYGYGHPNSMISFRTLSLNRKDKIGAGWFSDKLKAASMLRKIGGVDKASHRLCFAEGDHLPGLIIDRYVRADSASDIFVVQCSTAGMNRLLPQILEGLQALLESEGRNWQQAIVILSNDSKSRLLEGLTVEAKKQVHGPVAALDKMEVLIQASLEHLPATQFTVDFLAGQKTGFFLDQRSNVRHLSEFMRNLIATKGLREVRILDLCSYIGQWGAQLAHVAKSLNCKAHVIAVDASSKALELARINIERQGAECETIKMDVLEGLASLPEQSFDIVICDPPAFIKKKKDLPAGQAAYFKMNREAFRKLKPGGLIISCSCSGLLCDEDFRETLVRALAASGGDPRFRWLTRGSHSVDHPQRPEFPQGSYLKSWIGARLEN